MAFKCVYVSQEMAMLLFPKRMLVERMRENSCWTFVSAVANVSQDPGFLGKWKPYVLGSEACLEI